MEDVVRERRRQKIKKYVDVNSKSPVAGVLYALFYGPSGLYLYATAKCAHCAVHCGLSRADLLAADCAGLVGVRDHRAFPGADL